jgi:hypothetical protein
MFSFYKLPVVYLLGSASDLVSAAQIAADSVASQYSLSTSTSLPFPTATQSTTDAQSFIVSQWSLSKGHIQNGPGDLEFVNDPFPNTPIPALASTTNTSSPVLEITYPQGGFSSDSSGAQLYQLWNATGGQVFQSMMVSYDIAFDSGFNWVKGGKLPGLRGGPNSTGCSGGSEPNGMDCFSARIMWRTNGKGEVYAYVPTPNKFCSEDGIICNSDFGISVQRGAFTLASGQWNRITLLVQLNDPPDVANGNMVLYFNDVLAISQRNIQYRNSSTVNANGFYLSTFFGGNDNSWATPQTTHSYLRNVRMWAGSAPSNLTGSKVNGARHLLVEWYWIACVAVVTFIFSSGL